MGNGLFESKGPGTPRPEMNRIEVSIQTAVPPTCVLREIQQAHEVSLDLLGQSPDLSSFLSPHTDLREIRDLCLDG